MGVRGPVRAVKDITVLISIKGGRGGRGGRGWEVRTDSHHSRGGRGGGRVSMTSDSQGNLLEIHVITLVGGVEKKKMSRRNLICSVFQYFYNCRKWCSFTEPVFQEELWEKKPMPGIESEPKYGIEKAMSHKVLNFNAGIDFVLGSSLPLLPRINSTTELILTRNEFCGINARGP